MDLQQVINSRLAVNLVSLIARLIPPVMAYPVCNQIGKWIASRSDSKLTQAVRVNQWMARGAKLNKAELEKAIQETLQNSARDIYDLYHYIKNPQAIQNKIELSPAAREILSRPEFSQRGLVILGLHLSNFDIILQSIFRSGFKALVLTIPNPQGGRRVEFEMRQRTGMNIVPASLTAIRQSIQHLRQGGMVLTGMDRPIADPKHCPNFFGRPASLPTHYVNLALKAKVPLVIMAVVRDAGGHYQVHASEAIEMDPYPDREKEILQNAEKALKRAEDFIQLAPQQWNVPLPVWPDLLNTMS